MPDLGFRRLSTAASLIVLLSVLGGLAAGSSSPAAPADPADLALTKSDSPDPVNQHAVLTYTIQVTNNGPDAATNVAVTDNPPGGVHFTSATTSSGNCAKQGNNINCSLGTLSNGTGAAITIKFDTKNKQGTISNTASVTSDVSDPQSANNSDTETTQVVEAAEPTCAGKPATIVGTAGNDTLKGTKKSDVILALGGNDQVFGLGSGDRVCARGGHDLVGGGGGKDLVNGGVGDDVLLGGAGNDLLRAGAGADVIRGKGGDDGLRGGRGRDLLAGGRGIDSCRGGPGSDTLRSCP